MIFEWYIFYIKKILYFLHKTINKYIAKHFQFQIGGTFHLLKQIYQSIISINDYLLPIYVTFENKIWF